MSYSPIINIAHLAFVLGLFLKIHDETVNVLLHKSSCCKITVSYKVNDFSTCKKSSKRILFLISCLYYFS